MPTVNIVEASRLTNLSTSTLYKKVMRREIPHIKLGGKVLFDPVRLDSWIREHAVEPIAVGAK